MPERGERAEGNAPGMGGGGSAGGGEVARGGPARGGGVTGRGSAATGGAVLGGGGAATRGTAAGGGTAVYPAAGPGLHAWLDPATVALLNRLRLLGRRPLAGRMAGPHRSRRKGSSLEFADYREYVRGDDPRRLDWRALARLDRPYVREYADERDRTVHLLLDGSASLGFGGKDRRLRELAAAFAYVALRHGDRVEVTLLRGATARRLVSARGPAGRSRIGRALAALDTWQGTTALLPALLAWWGGASGTPAGTPAGTPGSTPHGTLAGRSAPGTAGADALTPAAVTGGTSGHQEAVPGAAPAGGGASTAPWGPPAPGGGPAGGGIAILLSDLLDPVAADPAGEYARQVAGVLAAAGDAAIVQVLAPDELDPAASLSGSGNGGAGGAAAEWTLVDAETGSSREVTVDGAVLAAYRRTLAAWVGAWRATCHARGVAHALVSSARPLRAVILEDLAPAGIVA
ncbi:DUF58 domain-containing protein [Thermaerobacter composti]|uniref:DUF58 domain-containing protein n=1 Tax=Thermaerobacter composti TaxID=554949 RepID=A0ABZ0QNQ2_9FIRM|nr:DUF58 domain-containing protein [Thermaerobacter composti]WPD18638.1 DUF58 domain-containing protein [Thermaerobacter composti]